MKYFTIFYLIHYIRTIHLIHTTPIHYMHLRSIAINSEGQMLVGGSGQWYQPNSDTGGSGDGVTAIKAGYAI